MLWLDSRYFGATQLENMRSLPPTPLRFGMISKRTQQIPGVCAAEMALDKLVVNPGRLSLDKFKTTPYTAQQQHQVLAFYRSNQD